MTAKQTASRGRLFTLARARHRPRVCQVVCRHGATAILPGPGAWAGARQLWSVSLAAASPSVCGACCRGCTMSVSPGGAAHVLCRRPRLGGSRLTRPARPRLREGCACLVCPFTPNDFKLMCTVLPTAQNLPNGPVTFVARFAGHRSCVLRLFVPGMLVCAELGKLGGVH